MRGVLLATILLGEVGRVRQSAGGDEGTAGCEAGRLGRRQGRVEREHVAARLGRAARRRGRRESERQRRLGRRGRLYHHRHVAARRPGHRRQGRSRRRGAHPFRLLLGGQVRLELDELLHEVEVGRDDGAARLEEVVGLLESEPLVVHEVGEADGGRPTHPRLTVHQHFAVTLTHRLCKETA